MRSRQQIGDGNPTMAWVGAIGQLCATFLKTMRDSGKHIVLSWPAFGDDDGRVIKRPMVATRLLRGTGHLVDNAGYMTTRSRY